MIYLKSRYSLELGYGYGIWGIHIFELEILVDHFISHETFQLGDSLESGMENTKAPTALRLVNATLHLQRSFFLYSSMDLGRGPLCSSIPLSDSSW